MGIFSRITRRSDLYAYGCLMVCLLVFINLLLAASFKSYFLLPIKAQLRIELSIKESVSCFENAVNQIHDVD